MSFISIAVLAACVLANLGAIVALVLGWRAPEPRRLAVRSLLLGVFLPPVGILATASGLHRAFGAVAGADPSTKATLLAQGIAEAMNATAFSLAAALLPIAVAVVLFVRGAPKREGTGTTPAPSG